MTQHAELIARLEAAEVGSRELDVCMWEVSDGWQNVHRPPCVTTSLDAALAMAERVLPGCRCIAERDHDGTGWACVRASEDSERFMTDAATPALALCIAILRALDAKA